MNLDLAPYYNIAKAQYVKSYPQQVRSITEKWAENNLYCPKCGRTLNAYPNNTPVYDLFCDHSNEKLVIVSAERENFQLKSSCKFTKNYFPNKILGAEYNKTINSLEKGIFPSLILLHYERELMSIKNALLIHRLSITLSCIQARVPLSNNARRSGWKGSIILLDSIPKKAHIWLIKDRNIIPKKSVQNEWRTITKLFKGNMTERGWTLDILNLVEKLPAKFYLDDVYKYEKELADLHPQNMHIRDKIRQQLQILRERGFIKFISPGGYLKVR